METFTSKKTWEPWDFLNEGAKLSGVKRKQMGKIINHQRKWHPSYGLKSSRNSLDKERYKEWKRIPSNVCKNSDVENGVSVWSKPRNIRLEEEDRG